MTSPEESAAVGQAVAKTFESLQKASTSIAKPWWRKREGLADLQVREKELLMLEKVELDIQDVRAGKKMITDDYRVIEVSPQSQVELGFPTLQEWEGSESAALKQLSQASEADERLTRLQQSVNLQRIGIYAWEEAENKQNSEDNEKTIEDDWIKKWRSYAKDVGSEQLQRMWAKILVEETVAPDSYSFHTLELLSRLSKREATVISTLASLAVMSILPSFNEFEETYTDVGVTLKDLIHLENLGLLNGASSNTLKNTMSNSRANELMYLHPYSEYGLLITAPALTPIEIRGIIVAPIGEEVISLVSDKDNLSSIKKSGTHFARQLGNGVRIELAKIIERSGTTTKVNTLERLGYDAG